MRLFLALLAASAAPSLSTAAPLRRSSDAANILVLNFANVLEQLETQFYISVTSKFSSSDIQGAGYTSSDAVIEQLTAIAGDEQSHQKILNSSIPQLGGSLVQGCTFNFDSVLTDIPTAMATARIVENVGVAAYLGAAHLLTDPRVLQAAGSILTVEARHQTVLNIFAGSGSVIPQAFDVALAPNEVLALASPFISGCDLGVKANPTLTITNTGSVTAGTTLTFSSSALPSDTSNLHCHMIVGGAVNSISLPFNACNVPDSVNGPVAIWITNDPSPLVNNVIDRDTSKVLVAGPTMTYIDAKQEALPQLVRSTSNSTSSATDSSSGGNSTSTDTSGSSSNGTFVGASATPGQPNLATGDSADGAMTVNGFTNPPPTSS